MFKGWERVWGEVVTLILVICASTYMIIYLNNQPDYKINKTVYETKFNECMTKFSKDQSFAECDEFARFLAKEEITK